MGITDILLIWLAIFILSSMFMGLFGDDEGEDKVLVVLWILSGLPYIIIGGIILWFIFRKRKHER